MGICYNESMATNGGVTVKRRYAWMLTLALMAGVMGCTRNNPEMPENEPVVTQKETEWQEQTEDNTDEIVSKDTESVQTEGSGTENRNEESKTEDKAGEVLVSYEDKEDNRILDDGTVIVYVSYQRPTVTVSGNEEAQKAINQDFDSDEEDFWIRADEVETERRGSGTLEGGSEWAYAYEVEYVDKRTDGKVISFVRYNYSDFGGLHGITYTNGVNYDAATGARLNLSDITEDREAFLAEAKEYILMLGESEEFKDRLSPNYADYIDNILQEDLWYFDEEGITFIANTYELASYAAGIFYFTIPYDKLTNIKSQYLK